MTNMPDKPEPALNANGRSSGNEQNGHNATGQHENGQSKNAQRAEAGAEQPTHTVLIVEDTEELAEIMRATLERLNLRVLHETHGQRALDIFGKEKLDLVLLDIALPDTTGWKVLEAMRDQTPTGKLPVIIVITAYGDPANRLMGKLQEIHSYMMKPLTPDEVEARVTDALQLRSSR